MLKVGLIGAGRRAHTIYGPTLRAMPGLSLTGVCGHGTNCAQRFAAHFDCSAFTDAGALLDGDTVDLVICCVDWRSNGALYKAVASSSVPALLETPLGADYSEAVEVARALAGRSAPTEIAEQYPFRPIEVLKRQIIQSGLVGDVVYAFNDGVGHEYHGVSLIRSYLGYEQKVRRVFAVQQDFPYFDHLTHRDLFFPGERVQHALIEFESGNVAAHHWSWLCYASPIRCRRVAGFHATQGGAWGEEIIVVEDREAQAVPVRVERRSRVVDGVEVLHDAVAYCGSRSVARWTSAAPGLLLNEEQIVAAGIIRGLVDQILGKGGSGYSVARALGDHELVHQIESAVAAGRAADG